MIEIEPAPFELDVTGIATEHPTVTSEAIIPLDDVPMPMRPLSERFVSSIGDLWVAPGHRSSAVESAMTFSVHSPSAGGARFTGRTDPLSRGGDYISSASYARRGHW